LGERDRFWKIISFMSCWSREISIPALLHQDLMLGLPGGFLKNTRHWQKLLRDVVNKVISVTCIVRYYCHFYTG